jgi:cytochrome P450
LHVYLNWFSSHLLKLLAKHQDIQEKARQEVLELDAKLNGELPDYAQITKCKYLGAVIKESQRILPVAPFLLREPLETRQVNGVTIPKGVSSNVFLSDACEAIC